MPAGVVYKPHVQRCWLEWEAVDILAVRTVASPETGVASSIVWTFLDPGGQSDLQISVRDNNVDQALKVLKKKMQREGVFREMKLRRSYEKPSERKAREKAEAIRRQRKLERKRLEREGF